MSGHTPGPWSLIKKMDGFTAVGAQSLIARVYSQAFRDLENEKANANLIAAAPDLLEALRKAIAELNEIRARDGVPYTHAGYQASVTEEYFSSVVDEGFSAIAKAEGR